MQLPLLEAYIYTQVTDLTTFHYLTLFFMYIHDELSDLALDSISLTVCMKVQKVFFFMFVNLSRDYIVQEG